jgi:hypothetical protein
MPPDSIPDTQTPVLRFLEALGTAETSLSSLSASVSQLEGTTKLLAATTPASPWTCRPSAMLRSTSEENATVRLSRGPPREHRKLALRPLDRAA